MTSIAKLKDKARKHEHKEDWQAAIQVYRKVLDHQDKSDELDLDLGLYNRIGDLHLRLGQTDEAVSYYETAADKYADSGFYNNAIALCNKALRHRPDRPATYLKLSRLCTEQGFQTDARRWILEYAERQVGAGEVQAAVSALEEFADHYDDPEVRELLAHQLATHNRQAEAIEQLRAAYEIRVRSDEMERATALADKARAIDPSVDLESEPLAASSEGDDEEGLEPTEFGREPGEYGAADIGDEIEPTAAEPVEDLSGSGEEVEGLETRTETTEEAEAEVEGVEGLERIASGELDETEAGTVAGLETSYGDDGPPAGVDEAELVEGSADFEDEEEAEPLPLLDTGYEEEPEREEEPEPAPPAGSVAEVEAAEAAEETEVEPEETEPEEAEPEQVEPEEAEPREVTAEAETEEEPAGEGAGAPTGEESGQGGAGLDLSFDTTDLPGSLDDEEKEPAALVPGEDAMDLESMDIAFDLSESGSGSEVSLEDLDVEATLDRARELVSRGLTDEAMRELKLLSASDAGPQAYRDAMDVVIEVIRRDENNISALQRRVEYAVRIGDQEILVEAYLDLAAALDRMGAETKAKVMYRRALNADPSNEEARAALGEDAPEAEVIDLDAILQEMDEESEAAEEAEGAGNESSDPEFAAMLDQLKARAAENVDPEDAADHYDLGLAFKEMGLIDEAIAEFQTALAGVEERLKVYEELGQCFVLKGQYNVAVKVFDRALKVPHKDEDELLGVYYHLGQCYEELGNRQEAKDAYRKVLSIDDSFADVPDRMAQL